MDQGSTGPAGHRPGLRWVWVRVWGVYIFYFLEGGGVWSG